MFEVHRLTASGLAKADTIRDVFEECLVKLAKVVGGDQATREMSIVRTKLQEASFFAKRAMAMKPENQLK